MRKTHNPFCPTTGQSSKESDYVNKATNLWLIIEKVNDIDWLIWSDEFTVTQGVFAGLFNCINRLVQDNDSLVIRKSITSQMDMVGKKKLSNQPI